MAVSTPYMYPAHVLADVANEMVDLHLDKSCDPSHPALGLKEMLECSTHIATIPSALISIPRSTPHHRDHYSCEHLQVFLLIIAVIAL